MFRCSSSARASLAASATFSASARALLALASCRRMMSTSSDVDSRRACVASVPLAPFRLSRTEASRSGRSDRSDRSRSLASDRMLGSCDRLFW